MKALPQVGYFTDTEQTTPVVDAPRDAPCPVCGDALTDEDVRTISLMPVSGLVSGFYRLHRSCAERLAPPYATLLDEVALWILEQARLQ